VRHLLVDGEVVVAGVELGLAGLAAASLGAAATAGDSAPSFRHDAELARSKAQAEDAGAKGVRFYLVLTDSRLLLVRRSVLGRAREAALDVGVEEVEAIRSRPQSHLVVVELADGRRIELETPKAFKFLPDVYRELGRLLDQQRKAG